jgi:hypothetical protein
MWLLSIYRPTVSNRKVTLSEAPRTYPEEALKQAHEKGIDSMPPSTTTICPVVYPLRIKQR